MLSEHDLRMLARIDDQGQQLNVFEEWAGIRLTG